MSKFRTKFYRSVHVVCVSVCEQKEDMSPLKWGFIQMKGPLTTILSESVLVQPQLEAHYGVNRLIAGLAPSPLKTRVPHPTKAIRLMNMWSKMGFSPRSSFNHKHHQPPPPFHHNPTLSSHLYPRWMMLLFWGFVIKTFKNVPLGFLPCVLNAHWVEEWSPKAHSSTTMPHLTLQFLQTQPTQWCESLNRYISTGMATR